MMPTKKTQLFKSCLLLVSISVSLNALALDVPQCKLPEVAKFRLCKGRTCEICLFPGRHAASGRKYHRHLALRYGDQSGS